MPKGYPDTITCKGCGDGLPAEYCFCPWCGEDLHPTKIPRKHKFVQALNPMTKHWVKIDRTIGAIVSHSRTSVPYKNVEIVGKH